MVKFIEKLSSGKFFATVFVIATYCLCVLGCVIMAMTRLVSIEVFLALFSGFGTMAGTIVTGYFNKDQVSK